MSIGRQTPENKYKDSAKQELTVLTKTHEIGSTQQLE